MLFGTSDEVRQVGVVLVAVSTPLLVALLCVLPGIRRGASGITALAVLPALGVVLLHPDAAGEISWLGVGTVVRLDEVSRVFLAATAVIWGAASLYAHSAIDRSRERFFGYFSLAMAGNLGLTVAADPASFYTFFSLMALSAYALITHPRGRSGLTAERALAVPEGAEISIRRAGRVYLAFTVFGEAVLLSGLFMLFAGSVELSPLAATLLLLAFGVKIGMLGVHGWMPVAYAAAPPAVAAALGGAMSTAGVVGLVRFLPWTGELNPAIGATVMALGIAAAFYGVMVGVTQRLPQAVLGYSSVSQFGLVTVIIGAGLFSFEALWPAAAFAATLYAVHHGFAKGALFLVGDIVRASSRTPLALGALLLPALALVGAPLTSGAVAKVVLKDTTGALTAPWGVALEFALPLAAVGTAVLMARFCFLVWAAAGVRAADSATSEENVKGHPRPTAYAASVALVAVVAGWVWVWPFGIVPRAVADSLTGAYLWTAAWPLVVGAVVAGVVWLAFRNTRRVAGTVPPGDIFAPVFLVAHELVEMRERAAERAPAAKGGVGTQSKASSGLVALLRVVGRAEAGVLVWASSIMIASLLVILVLVMALVQ